MSKEKIVAVSGGFDPIHVGHIRYLKEASKFGKVLVILNTDEWLKEKGHGHPFYTYEDRKEILEAIKYVWKVVPQLDNSNTVAYSLQEYKPDIFAKGGDRTIDNMPECELTICKKLGIQVIFGVGGYDKPDSSRHIIKRIRDGMNEQ